MLLSAVSVLVVAQSSSEIQEGLMNNPVYQAHQLVEPAPHMTHRMVLGTRETLQNKTENVA